MEGDPDSSARLDRLLEEMRRRIDAVELEPPAPLPLQAPAVREPSAPSSQPGAGKSRLIFWSGSGLLALAVLGAWFFGWRGKEHSIPCSHPSALAWQGDSLWISDWHDQAVYRLARTGMGLTVREMFLLKGSHLMGLAVSKDAMYTVDSWSRQIQRRRLDVSLSIEQAWPSPGPNPSALALEGKYLWSVDKERRVLYQHALDDTLTVLHSFPLDHAPIGLSFRRGCFWTVDEGTRTFHRLRSIQQTVAGVFVLPELDGVSAPLSAFAWSGGDLWLGFDGMARLLERPGWRLNRR